MSTNETWSAAVNTLGCLALCPLRPYRADAFMSGRKGGTLEKGRAESFREGTGGGARDKDGRDNVEPVREDDEPEPHGSRSHK